MLTVTGLKSCDTCRKALKWLESEQIAFTFRDVRDDGLNAGDIGRWIDALGTAPLLNKASTTWRALSDAEKQRAETDPAGLLADNPTLLKRPVFEDQTAGVLEVGFKEPQKTAVARLKG